MSVDVDVPIRAGERVVCVKGSKSWVRGVVVYASETRLVVQGDRGREVSSGRDRWEREPAQPIERTQRRGAP